MLPGLMTKLSEIHKGGYASDKEWVVLMVGWEMAEWPQKQQSMLEAVNINTGLKVMNVKWNTPVYL